MAGVDVTSTPNLSGSMVQNVSGQMPNIAQQQTWNNPSWTQQAGAWLNSNSMSQGMGMGGGTNNIQMLTQADQMGGQLFGMLAGKNESTVGNIFKALPMGSTVGNLINAAFGSSINDEFVTQTELGTNAQKSRIFNSNTNADVLNDWRGFNFLSNVTKDEVGSDGWFSNKAKNKTNELNNNINAANDLAILNFGHAVDNADANSDLRIAQSMVAAYGGPINSFRKYYSFGGPFGNYFEGEGEQSNSLRSPHVDLAVSNPWLYTKLHPSKKTKKAYEPTTFAGRVSQVAGASELGQKYTDYTSSVLQQVPIVGVGISALDLGYDSNRLYHNPSLSTTKDVALDAASLLPALRKTMKGWWMKGNSGSFITEGGQIINNPRLASSLEVMLQPYRTAVNTGIYVGRAADFIDDSKAYLKEMWNGSPIGKAVNQHSRGGYLNQAKALIRQNEGWRDKPYNDAPKGKNWRSVGYGFNDSGFREKYPEGISKHYEHGITKEQAEEELDYFLNKAEKQLKGIYGKQWNQFSDNEKAAILDTYYQRPASVGKSSRFYKAVTAGENAGRYLGVAGFNKRNKIRQGVFGGGYSNYGDWSSTDNSESDTSSLQEVTPIPVVQGLDLSEITPTQVAELKLNLASPSFDTNLFGRPSTTAPQQSVPTVGTVEDFLASYNDFDSNLFDDGGWMNYLNSWNQAQGGGNYVGQGQNLLNGISTNTSNGSVQDWMGIATGAINTISNWGKKDESLGRSGYGQMGMMAYDIMDAIRKATKKPKEPMDQKLGIPIYAQGGHLFDLGGATGNSGGMGAMGYGQIALSALKLASNAKYQASLDDDIDEDKINRSINRQGYTFSDAVSNVQTNGDLLDLWKNYSEVPADLTMRDFRDRSYFDDFMRSYAASWEGFNAGAQTGNYYAAGAGALIGILSSNIAATIGRNKAQNAADDTNKRIEKANERNLADLAYGAERVDAENDLRILQNMDNQGANGGKLSMGFGLKDPFIVPDGTANPLYKAFGGGLTHGAVFNTGVNFVNEGGSHGENPLGGVPVGADEQGIPNLVEEDEAIWNSDYVFSRRMKVPKKLREKYKLPDDATFADAVKKLTKESEERPLDKIARDTQDYILGELADSQEEMRMAKAQRQMEKEQQLRDDFLTGVQYGLGGTISPQGLVPFTDNISPLDMAESRFADGGSIHIDPSKKGTFKAQASKMGMGVQQAASHILANKEDYSPEMVRKAVFAHNFAHALGGSLFGNGGAMLSPNFFVDGGTIKKFQEGMKKSGQYTNEQIDQLAYQKYGKEAWKYRLSNKNWENGYDSRTGKNYIRYNDPSIAQDTSNRENENKRQESSSQKPAGKKAAKITTKGGITTTGRGSIVPFAYNWYRNGYDGIGTPTGFKVGANGRAYDYTDEYRNLVNSLGADDIRKWAAEHPNDSSLKSFLVRGNKLEDLTDDQWRRGATDGKYGFMHHVADSMLNEKAPTRGLDMPEGSIRWTPDPTVIGTPNIPKQPTGTSVDNTQQGSSFQPKPTWMRQVPIWMSGLMGLKEMLTPADYGNANMLLDAAYRTGQPVSIGTEYVGDYRKRDPFDERYLTDIINQNKAATNKNMMNLSGGNRAVGMSGILANDLTSQMALAEAARQSYLANRADDVQVSDFNYRTNKGNADAQNARNIAQAQLNSHRQQAMLSGIGMGARLRQAIRDQKDAAISANLTNFAQGLGDLGKENGYYNMIGGLNDEGVLKYFFGDDWKTRFNNNTERT